MSKKKEVRVSEEELEMDNKKVKKSKYENSFQKKKAVLKVAGWFMAAVMLIGSLIGIFGMLIYYR